MEHKTSLHCCNFTKFAEILELFFLNHVTCSAVARDLGQALNFTNVLEDTAILLLFTIIIEKTSTDSRLFFREVGNSFRVTKNFFPRKKVYLPKTNFLFPHFLHTTNKNCQNFIIVVSLQFSVAKCCRIYFYRIVTNW